jgi:uncharacterized membrane protein (DUF2068 family)
VTPGAPTRLRSVFRSREDGTGLSRRDAAWVLRRCARRGHVIAWVGDPEVEPWVERPAVALDGGQAVPPLLRCLRCGTWVRADDVAVGLREGAPDERVALADLPQPARGAYGRKLALLRLLAVDRAVRGLAMVVAALAAYHVASNRASLLSWLEGVLVAARPLGEQLGVHLTSSAPVQWVERTLGGDGGTLRLAGLLLLVYGGLQIVEGVGLWGGWRWAEYLAVVETAVFLPLEVYELVESPTVVKWAALVLNLLAVAYLVYKGRLFGVRGGHPAYVAEVRDTTEMAEVLRRLGRSPGELTSTRMV